MVFDTSTINIRIENCYIQYETARTIELEGNVGSILVNVETLW